MSVLPVGIGSSGIDVGDIQNSLRFRGAQYLSRTAGVPTSRNIWTYSVWVKLASDSSLAIISGGATSTDYQMIWHDSGLLKVIHNVGGVTRASGFASVPILRDPTAFVHVVIVFDSAAAAADRMIFYANGTRLSTTGTQNSANGFINNNGSVQYIGQRGYSTMPFLGYMARACFVDGTALTPDSFGYLNTEINEWVSKSQSACKTVVDAGGTNSFMLDFDTSSLGNDFSSKNNDWTSTNHSTTAGTTCDWPCKDVPGNSFATLNPIFPSAASITNGNLTSATTAVRGTQDALAYGSYWEVTAGGSAVTAGVVDSTTNVNTTTVTANKTFGFRLTSAGALDYINITDAGSWTSITTGLTGNRYPYGVTQAATWNFGQIPLHASAVYVGAAGGYFYGTPVGKALCQANLPDNGTVTVSGTFTGNGAADGPFVWINGVPKTLTINSNAVTFGTHADKTAGGFKLRTSSASYNTAGSNTFTATIDTDIQNIFKYNTAEANP